MKLAKSASFNDFNIGRNTPLLAIPIRGQVEQAYNAAGLNAIGVKTNTSISIDSLREWLASEMVIQVNFPDHHRRLVEEVLKLPASYK